MAHVEHKRLFVSLGRTLGRTMAKMHHINVNNSEMSDRHGNKYVFGKKSQKSSNTFDILRGMLACCPKEMNDDEK